MMLANNIDTIDMVLKNSSQKPCIYPTVLPEQEYLYLHWIFKNLLTGLDFFPLNFPFFFKDLKAN